MKKSTILFAISFCFLFKISSAQQAELLKDINTEPVAVAGVVELFDYNGVLLVDLCNANRGFELYRSDGTKQGTLLVKDINPDGSSHPESFCLVNDVAFFSAETDALGRELWKTDGTEEGTVLIKDIHPSSEEDAIVGEIVSLNGIAYFGASDGTHGIELWRSDGTEEGTYIVADVNPDQASIDGPQLLTVSHDLVYFTMVDGSHGRELWKSDGTASGTKLVKNIRSGNKSADFTEIVPFGSGVLMNTDDHSSGEELWISNGTGSGTQLVSDIYPGSTGSNPSDITVYNGIVYFSAADAAGNELWRSDGTAAGTYRVKDIYPGATGSEPVYLVVSGNTLFFSATDNVHGTEIHVSDGSEAGTVSLGNFTPGQGGSQVDLTDNCGTLYYIREKDDEEKLWISDGTSAGTHEVEGNTGAGYEGSLTSSNCLAFYETEGGDSEFWVSDGSEEGTRQIKVLADETLSSVPDNMDSKVVGDHLFFFADDVTHGRELWAKDLLTSDVYLVKDLDPLGSNNAFPDHLTEFNGLLYFDEDGSLWRSDGTEAGTFKIKTFSGYNTGVEAIVIMNGQLFIVNGQPYGTTELWKSDGTEAGTDFIAMIGPASYGSGYYIGDIIAVNGTLFFNGYDNMHGVELWKSDGTTAGTGIVADIFPGPQSSSPQGDWFNLNGILIFNANAGDGKGFEKWRSDGTAAGTTLIKDINPGPGNGGLGTGIVFNGQLIFGAGDSNTGYELWKSNGTAAGTVPLSNITPGSASSSPRSFVEVNGLVYFVADNALHGAELWKTDGTSGGTSFVKDIAADEASSDPGELTNINDRLFFSAHDGITGKELWTSDGTECNTFMVTETCPGSGWSNPSDFTTDGVYMYFRSFHRDYSHEPFQLKLSEIGSSLETSVTSTTLCPGDVISVLVSFPSGCTVSAGNVYTVQLSDADGDFTNPIVIGSLASTNLSESISCSIPSTPPSGSGYRIRTASSDPSTIGRDNGADITITCPKPENLAVSNITNSSAKLTWSSVACAEKFQVKYRVEGTSGFTTLKPSTNSQTISGLEANTSYEAKVRSTCAKSPNAYSSYTSLIHWNTSLKLTSDEELASGFSVYPNPASDVVTIHFTLQNSSDVEISLFDLHGKIIKMITKENFSEGSNLLDVSVLDLASGIYLIKMKSMNVMCSAKVLVE